MLRTSSGLMANQDAVTYIVTKGYGKATLILGVPKRTLSHKLTELELTYISVQGGIVYPSGN